MWFPPDSVLPPEDRILEVKSSDRTLCLQVLDAHNQLLLREGDSVYALARPLAYGFVRGRAWGQGHGGDLSHLQKAVLNEG